MKWLPFNYGPTNEHPNAHDFEARFIYTIHIEHQRHGWEEDQEAC